MKIHQSAIYLLISILFVSCAHSIEKPKQPESDNKQEIFIDYDEAPEFSGGEDAMQKYLKQNTVYPLSAIRDHVEGKVFIRFKVDTLGSITNVLIARGVRKDLDDECVRVVSSFPKWKPGKRNGKLDEWQYTVPIPFKLKQDDTKKYAIYPKTSNKIPTR